MGMGDSVTQTIFFVAALVLATGTVVMSYGALQEVSGDLRAHAEVVGQRLRSEVRIINDPAHVTTNPLTLLVKNVATQPLHPELWTILVDGIARTSVTADVLGSADDATLGEAQTVQLEVTGFTLGSGDHTVRVVTETGAEDEFRFHGG